MVRELIINGNLLVLNPSNYFVCCKMSEGYLFRVTSVRLTLVVTHGAGQIPSVTTVL